MKIKIGLLLALTLMVGSSQAALGWDSLCNVLANRFDRLATWVAGRSNEAVVIVGVGALAVCAAKALYERFNQVNINRYKSEGFVSSPSTSNHVQHDYGYNQIQGRQPLEAVCVMTPGREVDFFGVFDGHGGKEVADYVAKHLFSNILSESSFASNPEEAISLGCLKTDQDIVTAVGEGAFNDKGSMPPPYHSKVGSSAIFALIQGENMYVGNVGDSRAVLSSDGVAIALSQDQKPNRPDEEARIKAAGGSVRLRHPWDVPRVKGKVAVTRAFGDVFIKTYVPAKPEILVHKIKPSDEFLILGSHAVWDVVTNQEAVYIVKDSLSQEGKDLNKSARKLVECAQERGSRDNISVVIVKLN